MCLCPIYCFVIGCGFLGLGVLGLFVPSLQSLDLLTVQTLSHHRLDYLNSITTFLARVGGMPFVCFLSFLVCVYLAWYKKFITVIFISLGVIGSITIGWLLKWCVNRPRPPAAYHIVESYGASFPSAHSVYASTLACLAMIMLCHKHNTNSPYCFDLLSLVCVYGAFKNICRSSFPNRCTRWLGHWFYLDCTALALVITNTK